MTKEEFLKFHIDCCDTMHTIVENKNNDYSSYSTDAFAAFKDDNWTEIGFYTRMKDKLSRIKSFIHNKNLKVKKESVTDTLIDLANYCILFAGYLKSESLIERKEVTN